MSWEAFLRSGMTPAGAGLVVGIFLSYLAEYVPQYSVLSPRHKRLIFLATCLVVPVCAALLLALSGFVRLSWDPLLFGALQAGIAAFAAGTAAHTPKLPSAAESRQYHVWLNRWISER